VRPVRQAAGAGDVRVRPRRARCGCGRTHVLLPAGMLARRADSGAVIGQGLELAAAGAGHRAIGAALGRPAATVRGWLRALGRAAELIWAGFTALAVALDPDPLLPGQVIMNESRHTLSSTAHRLSWPNQPIGSTRGRQVPMPYLACRRRQARWTEIFSGHPALRASTDRSRAMAVIWPNKELSIPLRSEYLS